VTPYSQHNNNTSSSNHYGGSDLEKTKSPPRWQQLGSNNTDRMDSENEGYFSPPSPSPPKPVRSSFVSASSVCLCQPGQF
jgi:hypothetical protein